MQRSFCPILSMVRLPLPSACSRDREGARLPDDGRISVNPPRIPFVSVTIQRLQPHPESVASQSHCHQYGFNRDAGLKSHCKHDSRLPRGKATGCYPDETVTMAEKLKPIRLACQTPIS